MTTTPSRLPNKPNERFVQIVDELIATAFALGGEGDAADATDLAQVKKINELTLCMANLRRQVHEMFAGKGLFHINFQEVDRISVKTRRRFKYEDDISDPDFWDRIGNQQ